MSSIKSMSTCVINLILVSFLIWSWIYTSEQRKINFAVIHELSKDGYINITYQHDQFHQLLNGSSTVVNATQNKTREEKYATLSKGYMPTITYKDDTGSTVTETAPLSTDDAKLVDISKLILSKDVGSATFEFMKQEIFDKTFVLMIIFTISWTNFRQNKVHHDHVHVKSGEIHLKEIIININPIRIFINCTLGMIIMDWWGIAKQENLYANLSKFAVSFVCVASLICYMYSICHVQLTNLTKLEKYKNQTKYDQQKKLCRKKLREEEKREQDLKQKRKEWIETVTAIGLDRIKALEKNPEQVRFEDHKILLSARMK